VQIPHALPMVKWSGKSIMCGAGERKIRDLDMTECCTRHDCSGI